MPTVHGFLIIAMDLQICMSDMCSMLYCSYTVSICKSNFMQTIGIGQCGLLKTNTDLLI